MRQQYLLIIIGASNQGRLLKPQALLHFSKIFCHSSWDSFNFLLLHPIPWLIFKDYFPFNLYPFKSYFNMQRYSKHYYMQLKLWDTSRIKIKNHDVLLPETLWESFMVTHYNWLYSHFGGLKKLFFKIIVFVNSSR